MSPVNKKPRPLKPAEKNSNQPPTTREYALRRVDDVSQNMHGWRVSMRRGGKTHLKFFSDFRHQGSDQARQAAIEYRDRLDALLPRSTRAQIMQIKRKNNTSGMAGVSRYEGQDSKGRPYGMWIAKWVTTVGERPKSRKFSVALYGEEGAKARAIAARLKGLQPLHEEPYVPQLGRSPTPRPPTPPRPKRVRIEISVNEDLAQWLLSQADVQDLSRSVLIETLLTQLRQNARVLATAKT